MSVKELKLCSPVGAEAIIYHWPLCRGRSYNGALEIMETIKLVCKDCPELKIVTDKSEVDYNSYESMKSLCDKFNKAATAYKNLNKGTSKFPVADYASPDLLRHIVQQVYNRSVTEPERLNQYEPFTPAVYGETSFELISKMIEIVKPTEDDVLIDLGSGVGQVVVQVAGGARCKKCIGIEKAEVPATYARTVEYEFRKWMKWYGKSYSEFEIIEGDFLDPKYREMIMSCSLIFVNNFAFGPEVDHKLKQIFAEMHDGTKIVSSKAFCPLNFRISDRNLSDIGTIMNVSELWSQTNSVSWTDKPVTYYLHVIDRKKLEDYFASMRNNYAGNGSRPELRRSGSKASCQSWSSRDSGSSNAEFPMLHQPVTASEEQENIYVGTTTRRQYASWLAQKEKQKKDVPTPKVSSTKQSSVAAKRLEEDAGSASARVADESSSENTEERENEDVEDEEEEDEEGEEDDEEEEDEEAEQTSGSVRRKSDALRRPGRPRKSHAALKAQQAKKKYQKHRRPGRPAVKKLPKKKPQELLQVLDMLHQQIVSSTATTSGGDIRAPMNSVSDQPAAIVDHVHVEAMIPTVAAAPPDISAALNQYFDRLKTDYLNFFAYMKTPQYRAQVLELIDKEQTRQRILRERAGQLERQISRLQDEGVQHLRARMSEVGIQAETPAELLNKAKEIVMDHQALQNRANNIDSELRDLEKHNEYLVTSEEVYSLVSALFG